MEHLTLARALIALAAAMLALASLFAAGTPLTHGTLTDAAVAHLGGP